jgi:iron complex outermembrane receptor protein
MTDDSRQVSQEFNLTGHFDRFEGVLGLFYFKEHETSLINATTPPSAATPAPRAIFLQVEPDAHARSQAVFAQGTYHFTDALSMTAGIRYTEDRKELDQVFSRSSLNPATPGLVFPGFPFIANSTRNFAATTPKIGLEWQATPSALLYASATRGFKSGGTNYAASNTLALSFAPEKIWSYEAGAKTEWFDRRLRVNLSAFKYDYTDLQVQSLISPGVTSIGNAASATVRGLEIETTAKPTSGLLLTANYSLLDATYDRFTNAAVPTALIPYVAGSPRYIAATGTFDASGNRLNAAPKSSFSASAQFERPVASGNVFVRGEYYWQDRVYYDPSNVSIMSQPSYSLVNASIGYRSDQKWSIQLVGKNLADKQYLITVGANGLAPSGLAGSPRTIALQVSKAW